MLRPVKVFQSCFHFQSNEIDSFQNFQKSFKILITIDIRKLLKTDAVKAKRKHEYFVIILISQCKRKITS